MHFNMKNYLKSTRNHTIKHATVNFKTGWPVCVNFTGFSAPCSVMSGDFILFIYLSQEPNKMAGADY